VTEQDINDLLKVFDSRYHCYPLNVVDAIRFLVKQRDEARRTACLYEAKYMNFSLGFYPRDDAEAKGRSIAVRMRWNCFDAPHTNTPDVPVQDGGSA